MFFSASKPINDLYTKIVQPFQVSAQRREQSPRSVRICRSKALLWKQPGSWHWMVLAICLLYAHVAGILACWQQNSSSSTLIFCTMGFAPLCGNASHPEKAFHPILSSCDLFLTPWMHLNMLWSVFPTRSYPMEIAFAQLFGAASSESKYNLTLRGVGGRSRLDCVDEQVFCVSLARRACDWEMMQLFVREPGSDLSVFQIVVEQPWSTRWFGRVGSQSQEGPNGFEGGPSGPEDASTCSPNRPKAFGWQGSGWWQRPWQKAKKKTGHRPCGCFGQSVRSIRRILRF